MTNSDTDLKLLKITYDIITGMSYRLVDRPYIEVKHRKDIYQNEARQAVSRLITSLASIRNGKR